MCHITLSPSQQIVFKQLEGQIVHQSIIALDSNHGLGRTTILKKIAQQYQAKYIRLADIFVSIEIEEESLKLEEAVLAIFKAAWTENDHLVVDDFHQLSDILQPSCFGTARAQILPFAIDTVLQFLENTDRKLIIGLNGSWSLPSSFTSLYLPVELETWTAEDFQHLLIHYGGNRVSTIDFKQIYRFARRLNGYQLRQVCGHLEDQTYTTEALLHLLETKTLISNVNRGEVTPVKLEDLYGADEVIKQLEIDLITPIERPDLVNKLGISPKRGILLYGPPGTGKTTIGRALAHRLKSKFFLIDGTVISGTNDFYNKLHRIFEQAKINAPCILFIDDSDLLFEQSGHHGLYRYLLTMLDGLESESNAAVTVFMTAMNVSSLPPALIRSGRVELWLEMHLPNLAARKGILNNFLKDIFLKLDGKELTQLAKKAKGLTGADLKRICTDAINHYGYDVANDLPLRKDLVYLKDAVAKLLNYRKKVIEDRKANKEKEKQLPYWMS